MAKEQKQDQNQPPVLEGPESVEPAKSYRLYIALGFVSLILFQMVVLGILLSFLVQNSPDRGGMNPLDGFQDFEHSPGQRTGALTRERTTEVQIGTRNTFNITDPRADANETFSLNIFVTVRQADLRRFEKDYESRTAAVIGRVTEILRAATTEERAEAANTAIKERVKRAINDAFETPWVQEVHFTEVSHEIN